jgi:hypothetical protein
VKKSKAEKKRYKKARERALLVLEANPTMIPLLEMFAACDDVFTTEDSFAPEHIHKSLGRIYRQWKKTRAELDPDFNPASYPKKPRNIREKAEKQSTAQKIVLRAEK